MLTIDIAIIFRYILTITGLICFILGIVFTTLSILKIIELLPSPVKDFIGSISLAMLGFLLLFIVNELAQSQDP